MNKILNKMIYTPRYALKCITYFVLLSFAVMFSLTSCKDQEPDANPVITLNTAEGFISGDTSLSPGSKMKFSATASGENDVDLTNFLICVHTDSNLTVFDTGMHTYKMKWQGQFTKGFATEEKWEFIIRDRYGNQNSTSIHILADSGSNFKPLLVYEDLVFMAQNNPNPAGFFSFTNGHFYTHAEATADLQIQKIIDLIYYYVSGDENTISSPGANVDPGVFPGDFQDWEFRNTTRFIKSELSSDDFISAVNDSILIATYVEGEGKRKSKNLKVNDIYLFKTSQERLGFFMVKELTGTDEGSIQVDVKIQEEEE